MRSRLMAYSKGFPGGKHLRSSLSKVRSVAELEDIFTNYLELLLRYSTKLEMIG